MTNEEALALIEAEQRNIQERYKLIETYRKCIEMAQLSNDSGRQFIAALSKGINLPTVKKPGNIQAKRKPVKALLRTYEQVDLSQL